MEYVCVYTCTHVCAHRCPYVMAHMWVLHGVCTFARKAYMCKRAHVHIFLVLWRKGGRWHWPCPVCLKS